MALITVTVLLERSGPFQLDGVTLCGRFAAHESTKYKDHLHWVVTHIQSGMRVGEFHKTLHEARTAAQALDEIGSAAWRFDTKPEDGFDELVLERLMVEARAAGINLKKENFEQRLEEMNNSVNRVRMIEKRLWAL
jgi:hypothetical protein